MESALADNTFLDRARLLIAQRRHELAEQELGRALEVNPNSVGAHDLLAVCCSHRGEHAAAHELARRAIELAPTSSDAYTRHAWTILCDAAYVPPDRGFWKVAYWSRDGDARMAKVMCLVREALRLAPANSYAWYLLGMAWLATSRPRPALGAANKGLEFAPHDPELQELRARALEQLGRLEALATTRAALARDPAQAAMLSRHGAVLLQSGRHEEAMGCLVEAVRRDPTVDEAREGLLDALQDAHPVFGRAYRLHQSLSRRGWLKPYPLVIACTSMLFAGTILEMQLDLTGPAASLLRCAVLAVALGLPLSVIWLRHAGRFVLMWHPRLRHLLPPERRFVSHVVFYGWPPLFGAWMLSALDVPNAVAGALVISTLPLAAATAQEPGRYRRLFLIYAGAFAAAAVLLAIFGPEKTHPAHGWMLIAGLAGAVAPHAAMTRLARRRILA